MWLRHPSGLVMHFIQDEPSYRLAEGSSRNAETGEPAARVFEQGMLDPIHIRRGHHLAFDVSDMEALKKLLGEAWR
jgi:hypothetical protein